MKKVLCLSCVLFLLSFAVVSADDLIWGSMYSPGNISFGGDAAVEFSGYSPQLAIYPAAEIILFKPVVGGFGAVDIGTTLKGRLGIPLSSGTGFSAGIGALVSLHFGFRGLDFPGSEYLENLDVFGELGVKFDFLPPVSSDIFGLAASSGVNYYLSDGFAVGGSYTNWGSLNGGGLSVFVKIGEKPAVKGVDISWEESTGSYAREPYLLQFYTFYYSAHFAGGFYSDDYSEGEGTVHRITILDGSGEESYIIERALLKKYPDGRLMWLLEYRDDDEEIYYEFITDSEYSIETVYYDSEDDGIISFPADEDMSPGSRTMNREDYGAEAVHNVTIDVEAGRFDTDEYSYEDGSGLIVNWWLNDEVPGLLVSYKMEDSSDIVISELIGITGNNKIKLYK